MYVNIDVLEIQYYFSNSHSQRYYWIEQINWSNTLTFTF